ncbi:Gly-Xaa carboxypeptidase [Irineochytrium annulatum]|nr:Gly-Xaa carboxypeptidase [Irineochytrium annulatum]
MRVNKSPSAWSEERDYRTPAFARLSEEVAAAAAPYACDQPNPLAPKQNKDLDPDRLEKKGFRKEAAERLSGAVKINTVMTDADFNMPPPEGPDMGHVGFQQFHDYLRAYYPLTHQHLELTVINRYSLLYVWSPTPSNDSEPMLPPLLLAAHMDTVPVLEATRDQWSHEPWSGDIVTDRIYGRGAADTKSTLLAVMEAVEQLLTGGFAPKRRKVILAFGHDEEISGLQGARMIVTHLAQSGILDERGIGMIVDEGPGYTESLSGVPLAEVAIAEKGSMSLNITVKTKGGHSSLPPDHTAIGIMSSAIAELEANPFIASLPDASPFLMQLRCLARYGGDNVDPWLRHAIDNVGEYRSALVGALAEDRFLRYLMKTSQAVDVIKGGEKVNALPEVVTTLANHRIKVDSGHREVEDHAVTVLSPVAKRFGLRFELTRLNGTVEEVVARRKGKGGEEDAGELLVEPYHGAVEPAPVSPVDDVAWNVLAGTIRHAIRRPDGKKGSLVVAPTLQPMNTDTRWYWPIAKNIYRFGPVFQQGNIHTVDEWVSIEA